MLVPYDPPAKPEKPLEIIHVNLQNHYPKDGQSTTIKPLLHRSLHQIQSQVMFLLVLFFSIGNSELIRIVELKGLHASYKDSEKRKKPGNKSIIPRIQHTKLQSRISQRNGPINPLLC